MQVMFLMGSSHIEKNNEDYPFYLTEINDKLILEKQIDNIRPLNPDTWIFCLKEADIKQFRVDSAIRQLVPNAVIVSVANQTRGAICTALLAVGKINNDSELLLIGVDDFISESVLDITNSFRAKSADAGTISFTSVHPRYSFAKTDQMDNVVQVEEKLPISKNALVSLYYFKKGSDFVQCAMDVIRKDNPVNNAFYISQTLNEMILLQKKVVMHRIVNDNFHPLKNEKQLIQYIEELNTKRYCK